MSNYVAQPSATPTPSYAVRSGTDDKEDLKLPSIDCVSNTSNRRLQAAITPKTVSRRNMDAVEEFKNRRLHVQADTPNSSTSQKNACLSGAELNINDKDFDESDEDSETEDNTDENIKTYCGACRLFGITPATAVLRNLTQCSLVLKYHPLGPRDAKAIAVALMTNLHIKNLDLEGNNIGPQGAEHIADMLKENIYISRVGLAENNIGGRGAEVIAEMMHENYVIVSLNISGNNLGDKDAVHVADILLNNEYLKELNVSYNAFGEVGGQIIGAAIGENVNLTSLSLKWNHLRRRGAIAVAAGIQKNSMLEKVDLSWNGFGIEGAKTMSRALKGSETLSELDLSANRIQDKALMVLMKGALKSPSLVSLKIGNNPITVAGSLELIRMLDKADGCPIQELDITNIPTDDQFINLVESIQSRRNFEVSPGIVTIRGRPENARKYSIFDLDDPMLVLFEYMNQQHFRLIDLFRSLDDDESRSLTKEELRDGLLKANIPLSNRALDRLMVQMDTDSDGEISLGEFIKGKGESTKKTQRMRDEGIEEDTEKDLTDMSMKDREYLGKLKTKVKLFLQLKRDRIKKEQDRIKRERELEQKRAAKKTSG